MEIEKIVKQLLNTSQKSKKVYFVFSILLFMMSLLIILLSGIYIINDSVRVALYISGAFVGTLGFVPLRISFSKKEHIQLLEIYIERIKEDAALLSAEDISTIEEFIFKLK